MKLIFSFEFYKCIQIPCYDMAYDALTETAYLSQYFTDSSGAKGGVFAVDVRDSRSIKVS